jgi:protein disulfide-isomerase
MAWTTAVRRGLTAAVAASLCAAALLIAPGHAAAADEKAKEKVKEEAPAPAADGATWLTSLQEARAAAQKGNRAIIANFTGSDWCGFCIKLKEEVFSKQEFQDWAAKNVVLLEVDFPRGKELPAEVKAQNEKLQEHYKVQGFPSVLVITPDGKELGRMVGFGGAKEWEAELAQVMKKAPKPRAPRKSK